jgi:putative toxin-antitoxin system antitoxin component (TIGR02293 family)
MSTPLRYPILELAIKVFGDRNKAYDWFWEPCPALNNKCPAELIDTPEGLIKVQEVLMRIEYGVYS